MMPNGRKVPVQAEVKDEVAEKAKGMILSCEVLGTGMVALYVKYPGDKEEEEFVQLSPNGPGIQEELEKLILAKWEAKHYVHMPKV
jgi:hypothetical protein